MSNIKEKIEQYCKLKAYKDRETKLLKTKLTKVNEGIAFLENHILDYMNKEGINNIGSDAGTAHKINRSYASVKDRDAFFAFATMDEEHMDLMDVRANKKYVKEFLDKGVEVPGVNFSQATQLGIRGGSK